MKATRLALTLAVIAALSLTGCAEPPPRKPETQEISARQAAAAQQVLDEAADPRPGWRIGVVTSEEEREQVGLFFRDIVWTAGVLDKAGRVTTLTTDYCEADDPKAYEALPVMLAPGDLITWTGDRKLCTSQVRVLRKAGA